MQNKAVSGKANPSLFGKPTGQTTLAKLKDPRISQNTNPFEGKSFDQVINSGQLSFFGPNFVNFYKFT